MSLCETEAEKAEGVLHRRKNLYKAKHNNSSQEDRRKIFLADQKKYEFLNIIIFMQNLLLFASIRFKTSMMCPSLYRVLHFISKRVKLNDY